MKPYYQHAGITIYHGDCREILPELPKVELVITDPPYVGLQGDTKHIPGGIGGNHRVASETVGDPWCADLNWIPAAWDRVDKGCMVFSSFHSVAEVRLKFAIKPVGLLTWYARNSPVAVQNVPRFTTQFIWCFQKIPGLTWRNLTNTLIDIPKPSVGCVSDGERFEDDDGRALHPCQKPIALMLELLKVGPATIADPFMGTGTTLEAAKRSGIPAIGIEIKEKYCEIAAKRLSQEVFQW